MDLFKVEQKISEVKEALRGETERYETKRYELEDELRKLEIEKSMISTEINSERVAKAKEILQISVTDFGEEPVLEAIEDIAKGTPYMRKGYYGLKNYSPWRHQGSNHEYGSVTRHGIMVCTVGLKEPYRDGLTPEQADDCLYFLNLLLNEEKRKILMPNGEFQNN